MLVFRVEKNGEGPYQGDYKGNGRNALNSHDGCKRHPGMSDIKFVDGDCHRDFIYAFKSYKQYRHWFHRKFTVLHANGFKLCIYNVHEDDVRYGEYQIVFKSKSELPREFIGAYSVVGPLPEEVKQLIVLGKSCESVEIVEKSCLEKIKRFANSVDRTKSLLKRFAKMLGKINPNVFKLCSMKTSQNNVSSSYC